jgi:hypothetical protein
MLQASSCAPSSMYTCLSRSITSSAIAACRPATRHQCVPLQRPVWLLLPLPQCSRQLRRPHDAVRRCWRQPGVMEQPRGAVDHRGLLQSWVAKLCQAVLLCCCAAVLLCCCAAVLLRCCAAVLLCCCAAVLLRCCAAVLLCCCVGPLGHAAAAWALWILCHLLCVIALQMSAGSTCVHSV